MVLFRTGPAMLHPENMPDDEKVMATLNAYFSESKRSLRLGTPE